MSRQLSPEFSRNRRLILLAVLLIPVLLAPGMSWLGRALACVLPVLLTGTYSISRVGSDRFDCWSYVGFVPTSHHRCRLESVVSIHSSYATDQTGWGTFMLFGPVQWVFGMLFDYLIPSMGGPYEIWLETAKGREILAWKGYGQPHYEKNLSMLRNATGAELRLR